MTLEDKTTFPVWIEWKLQSVPPSLVKGTRTIHQCKTKWPPGLWRNTCQQRPMPCNQGWNWSRPHCQLTVTPLIILWACVTCCNVPLSIGDDAVWLHPDKTHLRSPFAPPSNWTSSDGQQHRGWGGSVRWSERPFWLEVSLSRHVNECISIWTAVPGPLEAY